jgi:hypothetical protein
LHSIPIALMKTNNEVEPAEINESGKPVGGMEPINISYCIINFEQKVLMPFCDMATATIFLRLLY